MINFPSKLQIFPSQKQNFPGMIFPNSAFCPCMETEYKIKQTPYLQRIREEKHGHTAAFHQEVIPSLILPVPYLYGVGSHDETPVCGQQMWWHALYVAYNVKHLRVAVRFPLVFIDVSKGEKIDENVNKTE